MKTTQKSNQLMPGKISSDYHLVDACQYIEDIHHPKCITVRKSAAFNAGIFIDVLIIQCPLLGQVLGTEFTGSDVYEKLKLGKTVVGKTKFGRRGRIGGAGGFFFCFAAPKRGRVRGQSQFRVLCQITRKLLCQIIRKVTNFGGHEKPSARGVAHSNAKRLSTFPEGFTHPTLDLGVRLRADFSPNGSRDFQEFSFTPRQLARILWDFTYLYWANPECGFERALILI